MRRFVIALALGLSPLAAQGHAMLERATPAVGSTVASAPTEVVLSFTDQLEPTFSSIEVRSAEGTAMQTARAALDGNRTQLRVPLKPLAPGTYKVIWRVLSVDTHRSQGDFTFRVGP